jgi:hypothetical protein
MTLIVTLSSTGIASAQTRSETTECEVCFRQADADQCIKDAREIDGARAELRECQRLRDADAGAKAELAREKKAAQDEVLRLQLELHEEKSRMSRGAVVGWTAVVLCSVAAGYGASQRDWKLVAGAGACAVTGGVVIWRW